MGRIPAGQLQSSANGLFLTWRMRTSCPLPSSSFLQNSLSAKSRFSELDCTQAAIGYLLLPVTTSRSAFQKTSKLNCWFTRISAGHATKPTSQKLTIHRIRRKSTNQALVCRFAHLFRKRQYQIFTRHRFGQYTVHSRLIGVFSQTRLRVGCQPNNRH